METIWFIQLGLLLTLFVVLDGFDFVAGMIYLFVARGDHERRMVLNAVGPVWDGNEVWLIIGGGVFFFAFPAAYASSFSGYYLALILLLWLFMFRGLSMELRSQLDNSLWHQFWDALLTLGSLFISLVLGVALGNVLRGVPLEADGFFFLPVWTDFLTGAYPGILDWYTLLTGLFTVVLLSVHGANYIALKTEDALQQSARRVSRQGQWLVALFTLILPIASYIAQPSVLHNYQQYPAGLLLPVFAVIALVTAFTCRHRNNDWGAFAASATLIVILMLSVGFTIYPNILIATTDPAHSLTIYNTATSEYAQRLGLVWFLIGITLAAGYTVFMYRFFRGKVELPGKGEGY